MLPLPGLSAVHSVLAGPRASQRLWQVLYKESGSPCSSFLPLRIHSQLPAAGVALDSALFGSERWPVSIGTSARAPYYARTIDCTWVKTAEMGKSTLCGVIFSFGSLPRICCFCSVSSAFAQLFFAILVQSLQLLSMRRLILWELTLSCQNGTALIPLTFPTPPTAVLCTWWGLNQSD